MIDSLIGKAARNLGLVMVIVMAMAAQETIASVHMVQELGPRDPEATVTWP